MKRFWKLISFTLGLLLAACSNGAATPTAKPVATNPSSETQAAVAPTDTSAPQAQATSRGDALEASDPTTVKIGAGRPVLIEFFRFT